MHRDRSQPWESIIGFMFIIFSSKQRRMTDRGRHHQRGDVAAEYKSRDYSHRVQHSLYDTWRHSQNPRDVDERISSDRRTNKNTKREVRSPPFHKGEVAYIDSEGPITM